MIEQQLAGEPARRFCSQCGARLSEGARFCSGCGQALEGGAPPGGVPARDAAPPPLRRPGEQIPGLIILVLFLAVGLGIWMTVLRPGPTPPGAPTRTASAPASGELPPEHPPVAIPEEGKKFIASLEAKAQAAPNDPGAWRTLAQVQARAAEIDPSYTDAAIESYRRVLSLAPNDGEALRGLGNVYYDQQRYASAAEQYEKYLTRQPDDASVRTDLATTYLYQRQVDRAIAAYMDVLAKRPDFLQAHFNLGLAYEAKGEHAKALASLDKARSLAPDDATRAQVERVTAQLKGETQPRLASPGGVAGAGKGGEKPGGAPAPGAPAAGASAAAPPAAGVPRAGASPAGANDFRGAVEAALRAHQILGPKISSVEWLDTTHARVLVHDFPMQAMPESVRGLFRGRLETILDDAKTQHGVAGETGLEIVDATSGTSMERVTH